LLQFLITEVDANLLEAVVVENLKTGDIEYTDEGGTLLAGFKGLVTLVDQEPEDAIEEGLSQGTDGVVDLVHVHTLGDELVTDLDLGLAQTVVEVIDVNTEKNGNLLANLSAVGFSLLFTTLLLEL
ncbi:hypothetical protein ACXORV_09630, partial [Streptococcus thermophilus]